MRGVAIARVLIAVLLAGTDVAAQGPPRTNIYRYVLDVDVPESPALVALDATTAHVLRGSAPKPIGAALVHRSEGVGWATGAAVDVVPYFFLGGGVRTLKSYRANSVAGRLIRVVTKTALSLGALSSPAAAGGLRGGIALRTTFHDPHDPVLNSRLPEEVDSALRAHGIVESDSTVEDVSDRGVDLRPIFAGARRAMRARGDVQVSAGWGLAGLIRGGVLSGDSVRAFRHTVWLTAQHALGNRMDVSVTGQVRSAFHRDDAFRLGLGFQRKSRPADYRAEVYYDWANHRLHPGVSAEIHAGPGYGAVVGLTSEAAIGPGRQPSRAQITLLARWYPTAER